VRNIHILFYEKALFGFSEAESGSYSKASCQFELWRIQSSGSFHRGVALAAPTRGGCLCLSADCKKVGQSVPLLWRQQPNESERNRIASNSPAPEHSPGGCLQKILSPPRPQLLFPFTISYTLVSSTTFPRPHHFRGLKPPS